MRLCWSGAAAAERLEQVETGGLEGVGEVRVDGRWAVVGCHGALTPRRDGASPVRKGPACAVRGEPLRGGSIQGSMEKQVVPSDLKQCGAWCRKPGLLPIM